MIRRLLLYSCFLFSFLFPQSPKHELRAVWISSAGGDWPTSTDIAEQQRSLIEIFDRLKQNNFNAIFFQVRPRGNVLYRSVIEPWATQLTGVLGKDPGYDPLAFAIDEARKRGLEIHAWFNVAKVWGTDLLPMNPQHVTRAHREWVRLYENEWWIDMGNPAAREYTENLVKDLVQSYDVDGIHFDYIRYPSPTFDDWRSFTDYSDGVEKSEWRRNNITAFVRNCYEFIQKEKPWVKVGSAPLGIYQSIAGAQSSFNGFSGVFQDSRRWLREGIHDYVAPQLYWSIGEQKNPNDPDFESLSYDWARENYGRHVFIGIGAYRENIRDEIREQTAITRSAGANGQAFFRYENVSFMFDRLGEVYKFPALVPPMIWKDSVPPNAPKNIFVIPEPGAALVKWSPPDSAADNEPPFRFVVYRSLKNPVDTRSAENILDVIPPERTSYRDESTGGREYSYTVTTLDRAGNESGVHIRTQSEIQSLLSRYAKPKSAVKFFGDVFHPFSGKTFVAFDLPQRMMVTLSLRYGAAEQESVIVRGQKEPGIHIVAVPVKNFPAGAMELRLRSGSEIIVKTIENIR